MREFTLWQEKAEWKNPIPSYETKSYLGEEVFAQEPGSPAGGEVTDILGRFYCKDRGAGSLDIRQLETYLKAPDVLLFIIEGDVGIGKTWFIRYHLTSGWKAGEVPRWGAGVVDLLYAEPRNAAASVYRQLCPILDLYFKQFCGGTEKMLNDYGHHIIHSRQSATKDGKTEVQGKMGAAFKALDWLRMPPGKDYAETMLSALEFSEGPTLYIGVDNMDQTSEDDQEVLLDLTQRLLRNPRIRLLVTLRRSSRMLRDQFSALEQVQQRILRLGPLNHQAMLQTRFSTSREGLSLEGLYILDNGTSYTFPELFKRMFSGETGELLTALSAHNCRIALTLARRVLESDHLLGLRHVGSAEHAIASMMLGPGYEPDETGPVINLFNNGEAHRQGNALIRYRVLEYLSTEKYVDAGEQRFVEHFDQLGYEWPRIRGVLSRFLMAGMVASAKGLTPNALADAGEAQIGEIALTGTGKAYFSTLLRKQWYYICAKREMLGTMPPRRVSYNEKERCSFIYHNDFIDYLKDEEAAEWARAERWESETGRSRVTAPPKAPHVLAKKILLREDNSD